jgi:hypothetical protein
MLINATNLDSLRVGFKTHFQGGLGQAPTLHERVCTVVPATTKEQKYGWLGRMPNVREWVGPRVLQNLMQHDYAIKERAFELTVAVDRDDIETDNLGIYAPLFVEMGRSTGDHWGRLVWQALRDGFTALGALREEQDMLAALQASGVDNPHVIGNVEADIARRERQATSAAAAIGLVPEQVEAVADAWARVRASMDAGDLEASRAELDALMTMVRGFYATGAQVPKALEEGTEQLYRLLAGTTQALATQEEVAAEAEAGVAVEDVAAQALARDRAEAEGLLLAWLDQVAEGITGRVPRAERDSWPQKEIAARALLTGKPEPEDLLLLAAEARLTGETEAELAGKIVANADAYRALIGALSAVRRTGSEAIRAADDPAAALAQAQARWAALAQGVGDKGP